MGEHDQGPKGPERTSDVLQLLDDFEIDTLIARADAEHRSVEEVVADIVSQQSYKAAANHFRLPLDEWDQLMSGGDYE